MQQILSPLLKISPEVTTQSQSEKLSVSFAKMKTITSAKTTNYPIHTILTLWLYEVSITLKLNTRIIL
jgi:hypothetical protein